jgi:hypothetical protein
MEWNEKYSDWLNSRLDTAEERVSKLKNRSENERSKDNQIAI